MTTRKNQNSILVLATLGVYLGLVLVGATPQVLAQAAMTKQFNVKDDLDKKPDPTNKDLDDAIEEYSKRIEDFVKNLKKLHSINEFNVERQSFNSERSTFDPCPETGTLHSFGKTGHIDRWLVPTITEANFISEHFTWLADCLPSDVFPSRTHARSSGIKLKYDRAELLHELSITLSSEERANALQAGLLSSFDEFKVDEDVGYELNKVLLKHTSLTFSGDQVFIITRLPRAGLDSLLAANAK